MQRVVSINLNGSVYPLEENGYTALFAYLDAIETRLKDAPDRAERVADIERVIAGKCQACLEPHKAVITTAEIARIISEMDPVPANERILLGVTLFYYKWEDSTGLPRQIVMSAEKQKLLQARRDKTDLATVIQETKL